MFNEQHHVVIAGTGDAGCEAAQLSKQEHWHEDAKPMSSPDKSKAVRILIADDHDVVRKGLRMILEAQQDWHVCAEAATGAEAVRLAAEMKPRIAVLDLEMTELDGLEAIRQIKRENPEIEVLIFTMHDAEYLIREVLVAGARAFVLKSEGGRKLIEAMHAVLQQKPFFDVLSSESLLNIFLKSHDDARETCSLTVRECEVVQLLCTGKTNKEAAHVLGISVKTVETHRATIMRKLGLSSTAELVRYAVRERLIKP